MHVHHVMASGARGGGADHLLGLLPALAELGVRVSATVGGDGPLAERLQARGVVCGTMPLMEHRLHPPTGRRLLAAAQVHGADAVHVHGTRAATLVASADGVLPWRTSRAHVPVLYTAHGLAVRAARAPWLRPLAARGEALACRDKAAVVSVSRADLAYLVERGWVPERRAHHVGNAVRPARFLAAQREREALALRFRAQHDVPPNAPLVGTVSRLVPQKDVLTLARAVGHIVGAHLAVVGDGPEYLRLAAHPLAKAGRLHLLGPRDDVPELLVAFDVFALASRWEGEPIALLEAMAAGALLVGCGVGFGGAARGTPRALQIFRRGRVRALSRTLGRAPKKDSARGAPRAAPPKPTPRAWVGGTFAGGLALSFAVLLPRMLRRGGFGGAVEIWWRDLTVVAMGFAMACVAWVALKPPAIRILAATRRPWRQGLGAFALGVWALWACAAVARTVPRPETSCAQWTRAAARGEAWAKLARVAWLVREGADADVIRPWCVEGRTAARARHAAPAALAAAVREGGDVCAALRLPLEEQAAASLRARWDDAAPASGAGACDDAWRTGVRALRASLEREAGTLPRPDLAPWTPVGDGWSLPRRAFVAPSAFGLRVHAAPGTVDAVWLEGAPVPVWRLRSRYGLASAFTLPLPARCRCVQVLACFGQAVRWSVEAARGAKLEATFGAPGHGPVDARALAEGVLAPVAGCPDGWRRVTLPCLTEAHEDAWLAVRGEALVGAVACAAPGAL